MHGEHLPAASLVPHSSYVHELRFELVRVVLRQRWPDRYQSMPLHKALGELHRTARVYKDAITLVDPTTGREYPTLTPQPT